MFCLFVYSEVDESTGMMSEEEVNINRSNKSFLCKGVLSGGYEPFTL